MQATTAKSTRPSGNLGDALRDIREVDGSLVTKVNETEAAGLIGRKLIVPMRKHFTATGTRDDILLFLRCRAGGSRTTEGPRERSIHKALRPLFGLEGQVG